MEHITLFTEVTTRGAGVDAGLLLCKGNNLSGIMKPVMEYSSVYEKDWAG